MPRKLRLEYEGAIYHLMNRRDRREPIFLDDPDRQVFLQTLGQTCEKTGWNVHAFCLMDNHFHLVAETPQPNLVAQRLADRLGRAGQPHEAACERNETDEHRAERLVKEWMEAAGWTEAELTARAKGDAQKAALAARLRRETPMTRAWIAQRLSMGSASYVSHLTKSPPN